MDMDAVVAKTEELTSNIPVILPKIEEIIAAGEKVLKAGEEAIKSAEEIAKEADALYVRVTKELEKFDKERQSQHDQANDDHEDVETQAVDELDKQAKESQSDLEQVVSTVTQKMAALQSLLERETADMKQDAGDFDKALDTAHQTVNTVKENFTNAIDGVKGVAEKLQTGLNSAMQQATQNISEMSKHMTELTEDAASEVTSMMGQVNSFQQMLGGGLEKTMNDVIQSAVDEATQALEAQVDQALKSLMDSVMQTVDGAVQGLVADIFGAKDSSGSGREGLDQALNMLDPLFDLIKGILGQVGDCASLVGVDFSPNP